MGMTDAGLRGRVFDKLVTMKKQISSLKYDDADDTLDEIRDILRVLRQGKK